MTMKVNGFTERQRQVVALIALGNSNVEIGQKLDISPRTAKAHADLLRHKLDVLKRRQIPQAYAIRTGENPFLIDVAFPELAAA